MKYWLVKSEPDVWSINQQINCAFAGATWDVVGIVKVIKESFIDPTDKKKKFVAVQLSFYKRFKNPVTLGNIKSNKAISHISLVKQSRLSVMPIDSKSWKIICKMGKISN